MPFLIEQFRNMRISAKIPVLFATALIGSILIVSVLLVAITYLGISDVDVLSSERCNLPVPLTCKDFGVTNDRIELVLLNGGGRGMHIRSVTAWSEAFNNSGEDENHACSWVKPGGDDEAFLLQNGQELKFSLTNSTQDIDTDGDNSTGNSDKAAGCPYYDTGKNRNRYNLKIKYSWPDTSNLTHTVDGELFANSPSHSLLNSPLRSSIIFVAIPAWLILSIFLVVTGRPDKARVNAKRKLGIWLLVALICLAILAVILVILFFYFAIV